MSHGESQALESQIRHWFPEGELKQYRSPCPRWGLRLESKDMPAIDFYWAESYGEWWLEVEMTLEMGDSEGVGKTVEEALEDLIDDWDEHLEESFSAVEENATLDEDEVVEFYRQYDKFRSQLDALHTYFNSRRRELEDTA